MIPNGGGFAFDLLPQGLYFPDPVRVDQVTADTLRIEGLIESLSLTAHMDMILRPGDDTILDITTTILPLVEVDAVGIAPLTPCTSKARCNRQCRMISAPTYTTTKFFSSKTAPAKNFGGLLPIRPVSKRQSL